MTREQFIKEFQSPLENAVLRKYPNGNVLQWWAENSRLYSEAFNKEGEFNKYLYGHNGIDLYTFENDLVRASHDGQIIVVEDDRFHPNGKFVRLQSVIFEDTKTYVITFYGHLKDIYVKPFQNVKKGEPLGTLGNTGFIISGGTRYWGDAPANKGSHLHFSGKELTKIGEPVFKNPMGDTFDPMQFITKGSDTPGYQILLQNMASLLRSNLRRLGL